MRYTRVGFASYAIAGVLLVTVLSVAWARSRASAAPGIEAAGATAPAAGVAAPRSPEPDGLAPPPQEADAAAYEAECSGCHRSGEARGRAVPALRVHAVSLFTSEGGREYLIDLMLDGSVRFVEDGRTQYDDTHPAYEELSNETVASILNHMLVSWGNRELLPQDARLYTAAEVAARRQRA